MNPCAVKWCCAAATDGEMCAVHARYPDLHPEPLSAGEELLDGPPDRCDECKGSGRCAGCDGEMLCPCHCHCGNHHEGPCEECRDERGRPTGQCAECRGTGYRNVRKRESA